MTARDRLLLAALTTTAALGLAIAAAAAWSLRKHPNEYALDYERSRR